MAQNIQMTVKGFQPLKSNLTKLLLHVVVEPAEMVVKDSMEDVVHVAREFAPEKSGTLMEAIDIAPRRRNQFFVSSELYVNGSKYNKQAHKYVADYAEYISENLTPYGTQLQLGKRSREKQPDVSDGIGVGGRFIERAMAYCVKKTLAEMQREINLRLKEL